MSALWQAVLETRPRWRRVALAVALGAGAVAAAIALLSVSGWLVSRAAQRPEAVALTLAIVGVRVFGVTRAVLRYSERLVSHDVAFRVLADLRVRFFARLAPLVPAGLRGIRRGDLLSRFVADVDTLQDLYLRALAPPAVAVIVSVLAVAAAAIVLPAAGAVLAVALLAAGAGVPALTGALARRAGRRQAPARAALTSDLLEVMRGAPEIAVAGREEDALRRLAACEERLARVQRADAVAGGFGTGLGVTLAAGAMVAVVAVAAPAVHSGAVDGVLLAALALLALGAFEGVQPLTAAAQRLSACAHAAGRLDQITSAAPAVADRPHPRPVPAGPAPLRAEAVRVRFGGDGPWVLDGVDLEVAPGRAVALVGASGAGKTTLAQALVRFRDPGGGRVLFGGIDLRELPQDHLRRRVRLIGQEAHLFATSLRNNLLLARPGAADGDLEQALEDVGLGDWLATLPDGLDTAVGEEGAQVSGGQRRRIAAARGLVSEATLLVFDEPSAHLDPAGARELLRRLA